MEFLKKIILLGVGAYIICKMNEGFFGLMVAVGIFWFFFLGDPSDTTDDSII